MNRLAPAIRSRGFVPGKARARRIVTLCLVGILGLAAGLVEGPRRMTTLGGSKVDIAKLTVMKYALEAYPQWATTHPAHACPASLVELNTYMNHKDIRDPWGSDYQWSCGTYAGQTVLNVWSLGEDQILGSSDDVRSSQ